MFNERQLRRSVQLSDRWKDATEADQARVLNNMQQVFASLAKWNVNDEPSKQILRDILENERDWLDPEATAILSQKQNRHIRSSVFHFVYWSKGYEWVEPLVKAGFNIDQKDQTAPRAQTVLQKCVLNNDAKGVKAFAENGVDTNQTISRSTWEDVQIPLLQYALEHKYSAAASLIEAGAGFNQPAIVNNKPTEFSLAQYYLMPKRCIPETLRSFIKAGYDPLEPINGENSLSSAQHIIDGEDDINGNRTDAILKMLCNIGVPFAHLHPVGLIENNYIFARARKEGEAIWEAFCEDRDYDVLDAQALCRLSNIGKLDDVFKRPLHWRSPQNAKRALGMLEMLPPYLQENYTHERSLMEEAARTEQRGWSRVS